MVYDERGREWMANQLGEPLRPLTLEEVCKYEREELSGGNPGWTEVRAKEAKSLVTLARASMDLCKQAAARGVECGLGGG